MFGSKKVKPDKILDEIENSFEANEEPVSSQKEQAPSHGVKRKPTIISNPAFFCERRGMEPDPGEIKIFVIESALKTLWGHAKEGLPKGVAGLLIGGLYYDEEIDEGYVEIHYAFPSASSFDEQMSLRAANRFIADMEKTSLKSYPDELVVGWYHTHPGNNIFFSENDTLIHNTYYSEQTSIALILDPLMEIDPLTETYKNIAFFYWRGGVIEKSSGYFAYKQRKSETISPIDRLREKYHGKSEISEEGNDRNTNILNKEIDFNREERPGFSQYIEGRPEETVDFDLSEDKRLPFSYRRRNEPLRSSSRDNESNHRLSTRMPTGPTESGSLYLEFDSYEEEIEFEEEKDNSRFKMDFLNPDLTEDDRGDKEDVFQENTSLTRKKFLSASLKKDKSPFMQSFSPERDEQNYSVEKKDKSPFMQSFSPERNEQNYYEKKPEDDSRSFSSTLRRSSGKYREEDIKAQTDRTTQKQFILEPSSQDKMFKRDPSEYYETSSKIPSSEDPIEQITSKRRENEEPRFLEKKAHTKESVTKGSPSVQILGGRNWKMQERMSQRDPYEMQDTYKTKSRSGLLKANKYKYYGGNSPTENSNPET